MANPWIEHVKKTKAENPELSFIEVLVKAGKTYKSKDEKGAAPAKKKTAKKKTAKKKSPKKKTVKKKSGKKKSGKKKSGKKKSGKKK